MMVSKNNIMKSDIREKKNSYLLEIELPGFQKELIQVYTERGYLVVSACREKTKEKGQGKYLRQERYNGVYERKFYIGEDIKDSEIRASYHFGILKLHIPKLTEEEKLANSNITIS